MWNRPFSFSNMPSWPYFFAKISANMSFSPNYSREVWEYKSGNVEGMQKCVSLFNWEIAFENISINEKGGLLNNS